MFKTDDIVIYGLNGICKIVEIEEKDLMGIKNTYLVLKPLHDDKATHYIPINNKNLLNQMRKLLSEDEINQLIDSISKENILWIEDERERKEYYKEILRNGNHSELIKMILSIHSEKESRKAKGRKLHMLDERFLNDAENILYEEFQYVLHLSRKDVISYIFSRIKKKETI